MQFFILDNNINQNKDNILNELTQEVEEILNRINELLLMFTNAKTKKIYYDLIYSNWQDIHLKIIDIFESISL